MHNTFTAPQTTHAGIPHPTLQKALRCCLIRLSRRVYTVRRRCPVHEDFHAFIDDSSTLTLRSALGEQWTPADSVRLRRTEYAGVLGTYRHYDPDDVIGGTSAALIHGVPLLDARPPRRVATVHSGSARSAFDPRISCGEPGDSVRVEVWNPRRSHNSRWIVRRRAVLTADQTVLWKGRRITTLARTCVDLARLTTVLEGVVAADWLIADATARFGRNGGVRTREALSVAADRCARMRGTARAREAIALATGRSESVAESLALFRLVSFGITGIRQQVPVEDHEGRMLARVDFMLEATDGVDVVIEVDGLLKYRNAGPRRESDHGDALIREKRREDRLRRRGYRVVRLTWKDLWNLPHLRTLLREAHVAV